MAAEADAQQAPVAANGLEAAIGAAIDGMTSWRGRIYLPLLFGFTMLFDTWDASVIALVGPALMREWHITTVQFGAVITAGFAGQFLGAVFMGSVAERFGRMPVCTGALFLMSILAILCGTVNDYVTLGALRLIQGFLIGGALPVAVTYINEMAPTKIRGFYFTLFQVICMSGAAVGGIVSNFVIRISPEHYWRIMFVLGAMPLLTLPLILLTLPESPRWLARAGKFDKINPALRKLGITTPVSIEGSDVTARPAAKKDSVAMWELFTPELRKRTIIAIGLWFLTAFPSYGLANWVASLFVKVYKMSEADALFYNTIGLVLFTIATPTLGIFMDMFGRKSSAIFLTATATLCMLALTFLDITNLIVIVVLISLGRLAINVANVVVWPYTAEIYPTRTRAVGLGVASSAARASSMLTPMFVGIIVAGAAGSVSIVFGVFGAFSLILMLMWIFLTKETAKKSLEDI